MSEYKNYELSDVQWVVGLGRKSIRLSNYELFTALEGNVKVIVSFFNEQELATRKQQVQTRNTLKQVEDNKQK